MCGVTKPVYSKRPGIGLRCGVLTLLAGLLAKSDISLIQIVKMRVKSSNVHHFLFHASTARPSIMGLCTASDSARWIRQCEPSLSDESVQKDGLPPHYSVLWVDLQSLIGFDYRLNLTIWITEIPSYWQRTHKTGRLLLKIILKHHAILL